ncbi:Tetratricopeptide repeat (TPR)-like superfamily protein [Abeliophyllum distichum]|uniref:Tetratricopeptide repeat (TPR)-like superfamily protein n=1 Tax=Abeliophyllum distichum TaxID=126358 RepID=A0ABD1Q297_9LAMI
MNSSYGKSNNKSGSMNAFDFDLGIGTGRPKSLNDQKNQTSTYSSTSYTHSSAYSKPSTTPAWTHKPVNPVQSGGSGSLSGPTSMVGDIHGKSWNSSAPMNSGGSGIGIVNSKNPNLFGDLVSSAIGGNKSSSNVPLKNAAPAANKSSFSMGGMADSLPKMGSSAKNGGNSGTNINNSSGNYSGSSSLGGGNVNLSWNTTKSPSLGGPSMKSVAGSGGVSLSKDPFGSLVDFSSKPSGGMKSENKGSKKSGVEDEFGDFKNAAPKTSGSSFPSSTFPTTNSDPMGDFGFSNPQPQSQSQPSGQSVGVNDFDVLFSSSGGANQSQGFETQQFSGGDDWGMDSEFGGHDTGGTTEIEGLPPPPAGVTGSSAKSKGMDNHKQGQYPDAIKWLSWAVILLEKAGDNDGTTEVLICRASCYKEVGEYKKAVADCTKVLEQDDSNVSVLVQRALLYESMEKYKLGAEDLRTVMKLDPGNRVARSTIHRLTKMAG